MTAFIRRRPKRYGSAIHRSRLPWWQLKEEREQARKEAERATGWTIPAGTPCLVRGAGWDVGVWDVHRTKVTLVFHAYRWRNESHYGFVHGRWEIKVKVAFVKMGVGPGE